MEQTDDKQQNKSFNLDMNKEQATKKRAYVKPEIEVIKVEVEHELLTHSEFEGQHTPVIEDSGELEEEP